MTERFFIVAEKSPLYKKYFGWVENEKAVRKFACDFSKRHGSPKLFSYNDTTFSVIIDKHNLNPKMAPLMNQLKKCCTWTERGELYDFKKNSVTGKAWLSELKAANIDIQRRPLVMIYFSDPCGRWGWETLNHNNKLYLKINTEREQNCPVGMEEIKGSEYYKAIEEHDAQKEAKS